MHGMAETKNYNTRPHMILWHDIHLQVNSCDSEKICTITVNGNVLRNNKIHLLSSHYNITGEFESQSTVCIVKTVNTPLETY
jgi:hypothetical protein